MSAPNISAVRLVISRGVALLVEGFFSLCALLQGVPTYQKMDRISSSGGAWMTAEYRHLHARMFDAGAQRPSTQLAVSSDGKCVQMCKQG